MRKVFRKTLSVLTAVILIECLLQTTAFATLPAEAYTSAPLVLQTKTNWCWAASSVSIVKARTSVLHSQDSHVYAATGSYDNVGRTIAAIQSDFLNIYSISSTLVYSTLSYSSIKSQVYANKPPLASIGLGSYAHALVIQGYENYTSSQNLRIMDPAYGWYICAYSELVNNYRGYGTQWYGTIYNYN